MGEMTPEVGKKELLTMNEHRLKKEENFKRNLSEAKVDMWPNIREEDG